MARPVLAFSANTPRRDNARHSPRTTTQGTPAQMKHFTAEQARDILHLPSADVFQPVIFSLHPKEQRLRLPALHDGKHVSRWVNRHKHGDYPLNTPNNRHSVVISAIRALGVLGSDSQFVLLPKKGPPIVAGAEDSAKIWPVFNQLINNLRDLKAGANKLFDSHMAKIFKTDKPLGEMEHARQFRENSKTVSQQVRRDLGVLLARRAQIDQHYLRMNKMPNILSVLPDEQVKQAFDWAQFSERPVHLTGRNLLMPIILGHAGLSGIKNEPYKVSLEITETPRVDPADWWKSGGEPKYWSPNES